MEITTIYFAAGMFTAYSSIIMALAVAYHNKERIIQYFIQKKMGEMF